MVHDPYWDLVPEPEEPAFEAERTAMLIIDLQYLDAHPDGWEGWRAIKARTVDELVKQLHSVPSFAASSA